MRPRDPDDWAHNRTGLNATPGLTTPSSTAFETVDPLRLDGVEFRPLGEIRLITGKSVWLINQGAYYRMPKEERVRDQEFSIEGRMDDGRWHPYRRAWFSLYEGIWPRARIIPVAGPEHGVGIYTGCILAIDGSWEEVDTGSTPERVERRGDCDD